MDKLFYELREIQETPCVSIIVSTHRTQPDNQKDPIALKNAIKEAIEKLYLNYDKREVWPLEEKLNHLSEKINPHENLESLLLFVSPSYANFIRLPIPVEDRVIIADNFATTDIIRAASERVGYYVLQLSRSNARLVEAFYDNVVEEVTDEFPMENNLESRAAMDADQEENYIKEFFNHVDKLLQEQVKNHPLPVIIATERRNYDYFLEICDRPEVIVGQINRLPDDEKPPHLVAAAWKAMEGYLNKIKADKLAEIEQAISSDQLITDIAEGWRTIQEGRVKSLFVTKKMSIPAIVNTEDHNVQILNKNEEHADEKITEDILDEMIEKTVEYGGEVVFADNDDLVKYGGFAAITR